MRTICNTVYLYDELPTESAREKARDWYRSHVFEDQGDWEFLFKDAEQVAQILGISIDQLPVKLMGGGTRSEPCIYFSGFWVQGAGAMFEGRYRYAKGAAKKIREYAPQEKEVHRIADALQAVQRKHFYRLQAVMTARGHGYASHDMGVEVEDTENPCADLGGDVDEIKQLMRDFADWIYQQLEQEYGYQIRDEVVEESIRANEYEFDEDGGRV